MLKRIEPVKVICYSEPFSEMQGDIIHVDYELSGWKYQNKNHENLSRNYKDAIIIYKTMVQPDYVFSAISKGSGSAYGGKWKPKKPEDERFFGEPNTIKTFYFKYRIDVKYGDDGRAIKERHYTDHFYPKYHSNPHDHMIRWNNPIGYPEPTNEINYWDNVPEFKYYKGEGYLMEKDTAIVKRNSLEENRFKTISDFKWCMKFHGEVEFEWKGNLYTIVHVDNKTIISVGCYEKDGKYYNVNTDKEHTSSDELWGDTAEEILEYNVGGDKLRDVITQVKVWARTI